MISTVENMIWMACRVYRHQKRVRQMLDPRYYEKHGRSRWLYDESQARHMDLAHAIAALISCAGFLAVLVAWFLGVV